jgi:hypothetical protein
MYLVNQFEHSDFDFEVIKDEDKLQEEYEELENRELILLGGKEGERKGKLRELELEEKKSKKKTMKKK